MCTAKARLAILNLLGDSEACVHDRDLHKHVKDCEEAKERLACHGSVKQHPAFRRC